MTGRQGVLLVSVPAFLHEREEANGNRSVQFAVPRRVMDVR
jgi:hypothetical protein